MLRHRAVLSASLVMLFATGCNVDGFDVNNQRAQRATSRVPTGKPGDLPDVSIVDAPEVDIVESVISHRAKYKRSLVALRAYYAEHGYYHKQKWAEAELADLKRVKPFRYILSAEVPVNSLRPTHNIAAADAMYARGLALMREGGHGTPVIYSEAKMREALRLMTRLITEYPNSDKIDDAAYCCGVIYKEYFRDQELLSVRWFERCRQWDPQSPHPALFQAAVVYDYRLHDRSRALELYHRVLEEEKANRSNAAFSMRRIDELTNGVNQLVPPGRPQPPNRQLATPRSAPAESTPVRDYSGSSTGIRTYPLSSERPLTNSSASPRYRSTAPTYPSTDTTETITLETITIEESAAPNWPNAGSSTMGGRPAVDSTYDNRRPAAVAPINVDTGITTPTPSPTYASPRTTVPTYPLTPGRDVNVGITDLDGAGYRPVNTTPGISYSGAAPAVQDTRTFNAAPPADSTAGIVVTTPVTPPASVGIDAGRTGSTSGGANWMGSTLASPSDRGTPPSRGSVTSTARNATPAPRPAPAYDRTDRPTIRTRDVIGRDSISSDSIISGYRSYVPPRATPPPADGNTTTAVEGDDEYVPIITLGDDE